MRVALPVRWISRKTLRREAAAKERKEVTREEEIGAPGEDAVEGRFARIIAK
jgi:hypothetical protein